MQTRKTLRLRRERLTELSPDDLAQVAGGWDTKTVVCLTGVYPTLPVRDCLFGPHTATDCLTRVCG
jgi:hypothetical protein